MKLPKKREGIPALVGIALSVVAGAGIVQLGACTISPPFDPALNAGMAAVQAAATDMVGSCPTITVEAVHDRLTFPAMVSEVMAAHRSSQMASAARAITGMGLSFEARLRAGGSGPAFCADKLGDIGLAADEFMTRYGRI
jgi:hypothetical protein